MTGSSTTPKTSAEHDGVPAQRSSAEHSALERAGVGLLAVHEATERLYGVVCEFDDRAMAEFKRLKALKVRIGTMDLRIASIVLVHDATLITRNRRDYEQVPGLRVED